MPNSVGTSTLVNRPEYNLLDLSSQLSVSSHLTALQCRIADLSDYRVYGAKHGNDLIHLYSNSYIENHLEIMRCGPFDHTMFESIDHYCFQKFPVEVIKQGILKNWTFEVHGVFPGHFEGVAGFLGYEIIQEVEFKHNQRSKRFNFVRPKFFICKDKSENTILIAAVNSGRDYVFHYASMLKHIIASFSVQKSDSIRIIRYPLAESSIHVWTELNSKLVKRNDIVIIGYVDEIDGYFKNSKKLKRVEEIDSTYYSSIRYLNKKTGTFINLIGVKYSFWGCISAKVTTQICRLGAKEVIYVGKLGTLSSPTEIYRRIFVPSQFLIMYHDKVVCDVKNLPNGFLEEYPEMDSQAHVSVPTVVEEDYVQREITTKLKITSIDNEISQVAFSVAKYNSEFDANVSFSSIHFATDYIRRPEERDLKVEFDLSNNRTEKAVESKVEILNKISQKLLDYLSKK